VVSQFDKDDVEAVGLVKFDFLGLRNLTIIELAVEYINARPRTARSAASIWTLAFDDPACLPGPEGRQHQRRSSRWKATG
jgi:DNA polymerase-3 subunit alpha